MARDRLVRSGERYGIIFYGLIMETVPAWAMMADVMNGCAALNTWRDFWLAGDPRPFGEFRFLALPRSL